MTTMQNDTHVPTKRIRVIDFGRGLAVFLMIFVHTLWIYADGETQSNSTLGHVVHFIGKGAAAFLLAMGASMMLSRRRTLVDDLRRAVVILCFGYMMNVLKFIVPISVFRSMPENFIEAYGWKSPLDGHQLLHLALTGDILQLAGVSLILLAFVRRFVRNKYVVLVLAFGVLAVASEVRGFRPGVAGLDYVADLFFADHYHVYFPIVPWISFILFGMFFGMQLRETNFDEVALARVGLPIGLLALVAGAGLCWMDFEYHFGNFFHLGPGGVIYLLGINLALLWVVQKLVVGRKGNRFTRFLDFCSERVTTMYVIQWTLICWGMGLIGFQTLNAWQTAALMPVVLLATILVQLALDKVLKRRAGRRAAARSSSADADGRPAGSTA